VGVERIDPARVSMESVEALALSPADVALTSQTALAATLRRAASFLCPTTPRTLIRAVIECLRGLPDFSEETEVEITGLVDSLVSYGDLLELPVDDGTRVRRQLYLGSPAFVPRSSQLALLIGIRPEGAPLVGDDLLDDIEYSGYARLIRSKDDRTIEDLLTLEGLIELQSDQWLQAPRQATAHEVAAFYSNRLDAAGPSGDIEGVQVIDPASRVTYYRGRWRVLKSRDVGRFVARRPQAFGADLWCLADVADGRVTRLIDLPLQNPLAPGADEAWRLQAAMDAIAGHPQQLRVRRSGATSVLDFFAPAPSWVRRRLDVVGQPVARSEGALFSYAIASDETEEEIGYLSEMMWLSLNQEPGGINDGSWQPDDR
jgi:hypothetical protein